MYLTRACLRREVRASTLRAMLGSEGGEAERAATTHRLVWTMFADSAERTRDFLWREAGPGVFYCLSARVPEDRHGLFDVDPPKVFAPQLVPGQRLGFALRVNATVARGGRPAVDGQPAVRGKPCDIVMDALHGAPDGSRPTTRRSVLIPVAHEWLAQQGAKHGFALPALPLPRTPEDSDDVDDGSFRVAGYRVLTIDRGRRRPPLRAGVLDVEGVLEVRQPEVFLGALSRGFGRAKAFGCGLMLIRRA